MTRSKAPSPPDVALVAYTVGTLRALADAIEAGTVRVRRMETTKGTHELHTGDLVADLAFDGTRTLTLHTWGHEG